MVSVLSYHFLSCSYRPPLSRKYYLSRRCRQIIHRTCLILDVEKKILILTRFARKSTHFNKPELGTASWDEFDAGLRVQHSENEADYTPDVYDCFKVLDWDQETNEFGGDVGEYGDVKMSGMFFQSSFQVITVRYDDD